MNFMNSQLLYRKCKRYSPLFQKYFLFTKINQISDSFGSTLEINKQYIPLKHEGFPAADQAFSMNLILILLRLK